MDLFFPALLSAGMLGGATVAATRVVREEWRPPLETLLAYLVIGVGFAAIALALSPTMNFVKITTFLEALQYGLISGIGGAMIVGAGNTGAAIVFRVLGVRVRIEPRKPDPWAYVTKTDGSSNTGDNPDDRSGGG